MRINLRQTPWWGSPRKFDEPEADRRVSWLELFYDLVYVIAISRITHQFSLEINAGNFLEFIVLFILVFWGWLNGSLYHDLHGSEGLRTRLMTLWQMMIIASLAVLIGHAGEEEYTNITVLFMIMQLYITYMWWSIGFYDPSHRRYNKPYTVLYLSSLALMGLSLVLPGVWLKWIVPVVLICNYVPPFISSRLLRRSATNLDLSPAMFERLGLFTIIIFGEVVLGVVNGTGQLPETDFRGWLHFALALGIVFELWWIFFTLIARREVKNGFQNASLLELLYIPSQISLLLIAVSFSPILDVHHEMQLQRVFGYALGTFLISISLMMGLLKIPVLFISLHRPIQISLWMTSAVFLIPTILNLPFNRTFYLGAVVVILILEITYLNSIYYIKVRREEVRQGTA